MSTAKQQSFLIKLITFTGIEYFVHLQVLEVSIRAPVLTPNNAR